MDTYAEKSMRYRQRAEHIRVIADEMASQNSRKSMLKLAEDYERLAGALTILTATGISN